MIQGPFVCERDGDASRRIRPGNTRSILMTSFHVLESFHSFGCRRPPIFTVPSASDEQLDITEIETGAHQEPAARSITDDPAPSP